MISQQQFEGRKRALLEVIESSGDFLASFQIRIKRSETIEDLEKIRKDWYLYTYDAEEE